MKTRCNDVRGQPKIMVKRYDFRSNIIIYYRRRLIKFKFNKLSNTYFGIDTNRIHVA